MKMLALIVMIMGAAIFLGGWFLLGHESKEKKKEPTMKVKQNIQAHTLQTLIWYKTEIVYSSYVYSGLTQEKILEERNKAIDWANSIDLESLESIVEIKVKEAKAEQIYP